MFKANVAIFIATIAILLGTVTAAHAQSVNAKLSAIFAAARTEPEKA